MTMTIITTIQFALAILAIVKCNSIINKHQQEIEQEQNNRKKRETENDKQFKELWLTINELKFDRDITPKGYAYLKDVKFGTFFTIKGESDNDMYREIEEGNWSCGKGIHSKDEVLFIGHKNVVCLRTGTVRKKHPRTIVKIEYKMPTNPGTEDQGPTKADTFI